MLNMIVRRSCRLERMFFVILFRCFVLFNHAIPIDTWTLHPMDLEGRSSIWYLRWSWQINQSTDIDCFNYLFGLKEKKWWCYEKYAYIEIVTKRNAMESHDLLYEPSISIRNPGFLLSACHLSSITGNTLVKFVICLPLTHLLLFEFPWAVRIIKTTCFLHHSSVQITPTE